MNSEFREGVKYKEGVKFKKSLIKGTYNECIQFFKDNVLSMQKVWIEDEKGNDILQTIRNIKGVQLVAELTPEQIKNKGHLIFE